MKLMLTGAIITAAVLIAWFAWTKNSSIAVKTEKGQFNRFTEVLSKVVESENEYAFVGISPDGRNEFFQISADKSGGQINFPLITEEQRQMEEALRGAAKLNAFPIRETKGSDGARFLDIEIEGDSSTISIAVEALMKEVFDVSENSIYEFRYSGV